MKKKVKLVLKLEIITNSADPKDNKLARKLGQCGINISSFCREYNLKTEKEIGIKKRLDLIIYQDKSYNIVLKQASTSFLLLKYAKIEKGSSNSKSKIVGFIDEFDFYDIIDLKKSDLNNKNIEQIIKILIGTAKSIGINII